jgi:FixJ family two-component response regulator
VHRRRPAIAVVDDDPRVTESLEELLESAGYAVCCFSSAEAFLACDLSDVDVLITDIGLPNVDGLELRNIVMRRRPSLSVFLITGRHEIADQTRARGHHGLLPQAVRWHCVAFSHQRGDRSTKKRRNGP